MRLKTFFIIGFVLRHESYHILVQDCGTRSRVSQLPNLTIRLNTDTGKSNATLKRSNNLSGQKFYVQKLSDGYYRIGTGVTGSASVLESDLSQKRWSKANSQKWTITSSGDYYTIKNKATGKFLSFSGKTLNASDTASLWKFSPYNEKYTVTFKNDEGETIKRESVNKGNSAIAPETPVSKDKVFLGWDTEYGNIKANTTVTAMALTKEDYVPGKNIVYVNSYGAKGDGVTDDTEAIQAVFNDPNTLDSVIIFKGIYRITKTITINAGGRTILPTVIAWDGPTTGEASTMFKITNNLPSTVNGIARAAANKIIGGTFTSKGDNWPQCIIWNDGYATCFSDVNFNHYAKYGLLNAGVWSNWNKDTPIKSSQIKINHCNFSNYPTYKAGSVAIAMVHTDNEINGGNINCCD